MKTKSLLVGVVALSVLLAGCTAANTEEEGANTDVTKNLIEQMPAATTEVDALTWNIPRGEPNSLDPARPGVANQTVQPNLCESLLLINPDYSVSDGLGSVKQVDDLTYEVSLKKANFWDGSPVTADDAIWSMSRYLDPELGSVFNSQAKYVDSLEKTGELSYTIHMKQPDATFHNLLAGPLGVVMEKDYSQANIDKLGTPDGGLMCTGPYTLTKWSKGESIVLEANKDYWDKDRAPLVQKYTFTFNTDAASATAAMRSGEIDGEFNFPLSALEQLESTSGSVTFGPSVAFYTLHFINVESGPLNADQRRALMLAIDYESIINGILKGVGTENRALTPKTSFSYSEDIFDKAWDKLDSGQQNLDEAKKLIEKAGKPDKPLVFAYSTDLPEDAQIGAAIQSAGAAIGIDVQLKPTPPAQYSPIYFDAQARKGVDMMLFNGYLDLPPEPIAWYRNYQTGANFNMAGYNDPKFDALIDEAFQTLDDDTRANLVVEAQQVYYDNTLVIPLAGQYTKLWMAKDLTGAPTSGIHYYMPWAALIGK